MSTIKTFWEIAISNFRKGNSKDFELLIQIDAPRKYLYKAIMNSVKKWLCYAYLCWEKEGFWLDEPYKKINKAGDIESEYECTWDYSVVPFLECIDTWFSPIYKTNPQDLQNWIYKSICLYLGVWREQGVQLDLFDNQLKLFQ